eukprot:4652241-Karenia_brevis.AAC.1
MNYLELIDKQWQHDVREGLRLAQWRQAASRRQDMSGIEGGVDRQATTALLAKGTYDDQRKGILR